MSPVTTYVSGLPSYLPGQTVVSSVFGKQLAKMVLSRGSAMRCWMRGISASTASLLKCRSAFAGLDCGSAVCLSPHPLRAIAKVEAAPFSQSRRLISVIVLLLPA